MNRFKRLSFFYLVGYLVGGGAMMLFVPEIALRLLFSSGSYGVIMPRVVGALMIALGLIIAQLVRQAIHTLYTTIVAIRVGLCTAWAALFVMYGDPLFLSLLGIVGTGVVLTVVGLFLDARTPASSS